MRWLQIRSEGWRVAVVAAALAMLLVGCAEEASPPVPEGADPALDAGRDIWRANCSRCHGGAGGGGAGPALKGPWPDDRQPDHPAMISVVTDGRGAMPRFGGSLSDDEIEAVVRYVREVL